MLEHWSRTQQRCTENRHQTALESTYGGARTVLHATECVLLSTSILFYHLCRCCSTPDKSPRSLLKNKDIPTQELSLGTNSVVLCAQAAIVREITRFQGCCNKLSHTGMLSLTQEDGIKRCKWHKEHQGFAQWRIFVKKLFHRQKLLLLSSHEIANNF